MSWSIHKMWATPHLNVNFAWPKQLITHKYCKEENHATQKCDHGSPHNNPKFKCAKQALNWPHKWGIQHALS